MRENPTQRETALARRTVHALIRQKKQIDNKYERDGYRKGRGTRILKETHRILGEYFDQEGEQDNGR